MGNGFGKGDWDTARIRGNNRIASGLAEGNNLAEETRAGADHRAGALRYVIGNLCDYTNGKLMDLLRERGLAKADKVLILGAANTNATFAIGLLFDENTGEIEELQPASKGVNKNLVELFSLLVCGAAANYNRNVLNSARVPQIEPTASAAAAGLHSEMAVVGSYGKDWAKRNMAVLCIGKPVCANCGGQMNSYTIPHGSLIFSQNLALNRPNYACDPATAMWAHPYSKSMYESNGAKTANYQHKANGALFSLSALQQNRPGRYSH